MNPVILIVLTGLYLVATLVRAAVRAPSATGEMAPDSHPLVLLVGSLLSLMALFSLLRLVPPDLAGRWPVLFHVGFLCLWLLVMARRGIDQGDGRRSEESSA